MNDAIAQLSAKGIQTTVVTHKDYYADTWDEVTDGYIIGDGSGFLSLSDVYADLTSKTGGTIIDMSEDFEKDLSTYAKSIIAATASTEVDDSYVTGNINFFRRGRRSAGCNWWSIQIPNYSKSF